MMLKLPKVRRDGKFINTVIDANEIKGMEEKTFLFQGSPFNGTKVYANGGSFYVCAPLMMVAEAKMTALLSGQMVEVEAPKAHVQYIGGGMKVHKMLAKSV